MCKCCSISLAACRLLPPLPPTFSLSCVSLWPRTRTPLRRLLHWFLLRKEEEEKPLRTWYGSREWGRTRVRRVTPWLGVREEAFIRRPSFIKCFINSSDGAKASVWHQSGARLWFAVQMCPTVLSCSPATRPIQKYSTRAGNPLL